MRQTSRLLSFALCVLLYGCQSSAPVLPSPINSNVTSSEPTTRIAVIGDFGSGNEHEAAVSLAVEAQNPTAVVTVGDNTYGGRESWQTRIGRYYGQFIKRDPTIADERSSPENRFFPTLGNHDWDAGITGYTNYFQLPGNERYYSVRQGPMEFFILSSDRREPDGNTPGSTQEQWLKQALLQSSAPWKIISLHEPAYTSPSLHTSSHNMRWAFTGATVVLQGHNHFYERLEINNLTYVTTGNSGKNLYLLAGPRKDGSIAIDTEHYGYVLLDGSETQLNLTAYTETGGVIDRKVWTR